MKDRTILLRTQKHVYEGKKMSNYPKTIKALVSYGKTDYRFESAYPSPECGDDDIIIKVEGCISLKREKCKKFRQLWHLPCAFTIAGFFQRPYGR
jgi:hypothetical protein